MPPIIELKNISKCYKLGSISGGSLREDISSWFNKSKPSKESSAKEFWALKDISFTVEQGEVIGIIGHNGAGKSTLLKILSRITEPTDGEAILRGRVASLLEVGTGFHPELTGRENIYLNGTTLGMKKREIDAKLDEIIDFSGCEKFIDTPIKRYSSGMMVRLGFSVAAHLDPEILIIDEVLAVGDVNFQKRCIKKMSSIAKEEGRTIFFVSHNMAMIESLCTQTMLMDKGSLNDIGSTKKIIPTYLDSLRSTVKQTEYNNSDLNKKMRLTSCSMKNGAGECQAKAVAGLPFVLSIEFEVHDEYQPFDPLVIIQVKSANDTPLFIQHNLLHNYHLKNLSKQNQIECHLLEFPLTEGIYYVDLKILDNAEILDDITNALEIQTEQSDYFKSGEIPDSQYGALMIRAEWSLINN
jgi:lipopolysaccharide transport system ATP-binding protein